MTQPPPPPPGAIQRRRWRWRRLVWILSPLWLVLALLAEENLRGRWELWRVENALHTRGERLTFPELGLPPPLPAGNAAPEALAAAAALKKLGDHSRLVSAGPRHMMNPAEPGSASSASREARFPSYDGNRDPKRKGAPSDDWLLANTQLAAAQIPLDRLRAALAQPALALASPYGLAVPSSGDLFSAHRWLMSHGVCAVHAGNLEAAIDDIVASCALARLTRSDFHLISQHTAALIDRFATALAWEALQAGGWTPAQLERLQRGLEPADDLAAAVRSLEVERVMSRLTVGSVRRRPSLLAIPLRMEGRDFIEDFLGESTEPLPAEWKVWLHVFLWEAAWSHQDEARALTLWQGLLTPARRMAVDRSWTSFAVSYPKAPAAANDLSQWPWVISNLMHPSSARYLLSNLGQYETERQMALAAIALKRHELGEGKLPASLDALVPKYLPKAPLDFMDGKPLRCRLGPDGSYKIYSVGLDGRDDGGDPGAAVGNARLRSLWAGRDAVWPVLAIPKAAPGAPAF